MSSFKMAALVSGALKTRLYIRPQVLRTFVRGYAAEADPEEYGYYPDPLEHAMGREKKMMIARLAGDDRYEPKVYYRGESSTRDKPNLVPAHYQDQMVGCLCEPDNGHVNFMMIRKGQPKRCICGAWYKAIDCDPEYV